MHQLTRLLRFTGSQLLAIVTFQLVCTTGVAHAQSAANVAVVINDNSPDSQKVGEYYARSRSLPKSNILRIRTSTEETIDRGQYMATIEGAIGNQIIRAGLQDRLLYLVLTKGVPLRIGATAATADTISSVDSELTLLYRRMTGVAVPVPGRIDNPYYLKSHAIDEARPFTHRDYDIFLVTRLDGFTVEDAIALIDRAAAPVTQGRIVLDQQDKLLNRTGEDWLQQAADQLTARGQGARVLLEKTVTGVRDVPQVMGYYSWGSNDPRNRVRKFGLGFVPGSIAGMYVSSDGRTFREPPSDWTPADTSDQSKWFGGSPQSLIGDLIREGVTGVSGHVAEPFLEATAKPDILFPAYLTGFNLVEAFYLSMPYLSWQNIVIGDPLCAPFQDPKRRFDGDGGEDAGTTLPAFFSKRRVAAIVAALPDIPEEAIVLNTRAEALTARGDREGAQASFEKATTVAPRYVAAQLQLAQLYEFTNQFDRAADRYRKVLEVQPQNLLALNNLAYHLAERRGTPAEGLPLSRRAVALAPQNPVILDTLAWIEYLTGDSATAVKRMPQILRSLPGNAEVRMHAAVIYAANGAKAVAEDQLQEALKLNPAIDPEKVKQVRAEIAKLAGKQ
jgi:uncharacterized protein (TIGR03790 family)